MNPASEEQNIDTIASELRLSNQYEIIAMLGKGAMGRVYKAKDLGLDRFVAIKIIEFGTSADTGRLLHRFKNEARILKEVNHPNIVKVFKFDVAGNNEPFIVMEYLPGRTLKAVLQNGPLSVDRFASIFTQAITGLANAHKVGILHRDIKPDNIMLTGEGESIVKLLDFGVAKDLAVSDQKTTTAGASVGTPAYMSPEQMAGMEIDERSDIYSMCCVMYESITGKLPYESTNSFDLMMSKASYLPESITAFSPTHNGAALNRIIMRGLSQEPSERYQTADELLAELDLAVGAEIPVKTGPAATNSSPQRIPTKAVTIAAMLVLVAIAAPFIIQRMQPATQVQQDEAELNTGIELITKHSTGETKDESDKFILDAIPHLRKAAEHLPKAKLYLAKAFVLHHQYRDAIDILEKEIPGASQNIPNNQYSPELCSACEDLALSYENINDHAQAAEWYMKVLQQQQLGHLGPELLRLTNHSIGESLFNSGEFAKACPYLQTSAALGRKYNDWQFQTTSLELGKALVECQRYDEAIPVLDQLISTLGGNADPAYEAAILEAKEYLARAKARQ